MTTHSIREKSRPMVAHTRAVHMIAALACLALALCGPMAPPSGAEAYCYITSAKSEAVSNAVQVEVKADGILKWDWDSHDDDSPRQVISVRFDNARLKIDEHFLEVDTPPLSTISLYTPQDATDGTGGGMQVDRTERCTFKGTSSTGERTCVLTVDAPLRSEGDTKAAGSGGKAEGQELLSIEVTETALLHDPGRSARELAALSRAGIGISLDDFGTGYSSLSWLTQFPVDVVKICLLYTSPSPRDS